uniref:C-type lectin domain-containing protein n=1 Tax=Gasterosteus aculeatus aculeatus TaxID=481459 RepID=G3Q6R8_GASAC|nr:macrophage mannose receptor 1-like [Gasterosteus aculeatus aculeatus]
MERIIVLLFLCTAVEAFVGKHIFVKEKKNWSEALDHCRTHYTDLSFVISQSDQDRLQSASEGTFCKGWIGLQQDTSGSTAAWMWSAGGRVTYENWRNGEPNNFKDAEHVGEVLRNGEWNDNEEEQSSPFYCINITVVVEEKSWEEALQHCRENKADLSSLHSDTENIAAGKDQKGVRTTELVWIGLRFLADRWLWVNGDPLEYEAWPKGGVQDHQCPMQNRCGALNKEGLWVNRDCEEKLNFICS